MSAISEAILKLLRPKRCNQNISVLRNILFYKVNFYKKATLIRVAFFGFYNLINLKITINDWERLIFDHAVA